MGAILGTVILEMRSELEPTRLEAMRWLHFLLARAQELVLQQVRKGSACSAKYRARVEHGTAEGGTPRASLDAYHPRECLEGARAGNGSSQFAPASFAHRHCPPLVPPRAASRCSGCCDRCLARVSNTLLPHPATCSQVSRLLPPLLDALSAPSEPVVTSGLGVLAALADCPGQFT